VIILHKLVGCRSNTMVRKITSNISKGAKNKPVINGAGRLYFAPMTSASVAKTA
jgi:hypothetical protein